jgi:hypothetical protein
MPDTAPGSCKPNASHFQREIRRSNKVNIVWGVILIIFSLLAWLGQTITALWPRVAVNLDLTEEEGEVDPAFYADVRGEAYWDMAVLWTLPVAGLLLLMNSPVWAYFGLVGGGMFLYFAGRGITTRRVLQGRGIRIGKPETLNLFYGALAVWGLIAVITIIMAVAALLVP